MRQARPPTNVMRNIPSFNFVLATLFKRRRPLLPATSHHSACWGLAPSFDRILHGLHGVGPPKLLHARTELRPKHASHIKCRAIQRPSCQYLYAHASGTSTRPQGNGRIKPPNSMKLYPTALAAAPNRKLKLDASRSPSTHGNTYVARVSGRLWACPSSR